MLLILWIITLIKDSAPLPNPEEYFLSSSCCGQSISSQHDSYSVLLVYLQNGIAEKWTIPVIPNGQVYLCTLQNNRGSLKCYFALDWSPRMSDYYGLVWTLWLSSHYETEYNSWKEMWLSRLPLPFFYFDESTENLAAFQAMIACSLFFAEPYSRPGAALYSEIRARRDSAIPFLLIWFYREVNTASAVKQSEHTLPAI